MSQIVKFIATLAFISPVVLTCSQVGEKENPQGRIESPSEANALPTPMPTSPTLSLYNKPTILNSLYSGPLNEQKTQCTTSQNLRTFYRTVGSRKSSNTLDLLDPLEADLDPKRDIRGVVIKLSENGEKFMLDINFGEATTGKKVKVIFGHYDKADSTKTMIVRNYLSTETREILEQTNEQAPTVSSGLWQTSLEKMQIVWDRRELDEVFFADYFWMKILTLSDTDQIEDETSSFLIKTQALEQPADIVTCTIEELSRLYHVHIEKDLFSYDLVNRLIFIERLIAQHDLTPFTKRSEMLILKRNTQQDHLWDIVQNKDSGFYDESTLFLDAEHLNSESESFYKSIFHQLLRHRLTHQTSLLKPLEAFIVNQMLWYQQCPLHFTLSLCNTDYFANADLFLKNPDESFPKDIFEIANLAPGNVERAYLLSKLSALSWIFSNFINLDAILPALILGPYDFDTIMVKGLTQSNYQEFKKGWIDSQQAYHFSVHPYLTQDSDGDGLTNLAEQRANLNPEHQDSDGDGWTDFAELSLNTNPLDRNASPETIVIDGGFRDWQIIFPLELIDYSEIKEKPKNSCSESLELLSYMAIFKEKDLYFAALLDSKLADQDIVGIQLEITQLGTKAITLLQYQNSHELEVKYLNTEQKIVPIKKVFPHNMNGKAWEWNFDFSFLSPIGPVENAELKLKLLKNNTKTLDESHCLTTPSFKPYVLKD